GEAADGDWTLEEAVGVFKKVTYGVSPCLGNEGVVGVLRAFGGDVYSADGKQVLIGKPESMAGIQWLADLWNKHKVALPLDPGGKQPNALDFFPNEKILCFSSNVAAVASVRRVVDDKFKWSILPPPTLKPG